MFAWLVRHEDSSSFDFATENRSCWNPQDRKSTRLNSSHANISYAVFCLKKKKTHRRGVGDRGLAEPLDAGGGGGVRRASQPGGRSTRCIADDRPWHAVLTGALPSSTVRV